MMFIMAREKNFGKMVQTMQVHSLQVKRMDTACTSGQIKLPMKEVGSITK